MQTDVVCSVLGFFGLFLCYFGHRYFKFGKCTSKGPRPDQKKEPRDATACCLKTDSFVHQPISFVEMFAFGFLSFGFVTYVLLGRYVAAHSIGKCCWVANRNSVDNFFLKRPVWCLLWSTSNKKDFSCCSFDVIECSWSSCWGSCLGFVLVVPRCSSSVCFAGRIVCRISVHSHCLQLDAAR